MSSNWWPTEDIAAVKKLSWQNTAGQMLRTVEDLGNQVTEAASSMLPDLDQLWGTPDQAQAAAPATDEWGLPDLDSYFGSSKPAPAAPASGTPQPMPTAPVAPTLNVTTGQRVTGDVPQPGDQIGSVTAASGPADPEAERIRAAGTRASRYADTIARIAKEEGVPADGLAALLDTENSGETSTSVDGARGVMQVVPGQGFDLPGEDPFDPETSIRQGARAYREKMRMVGGDPDEAMAAYFGYGSDSLGNTTSTYRETARANRARYGAPAAPTRVSTSPPPTAAELPEVQGQGSYAAGSFTPNQINAATAEGLDYETALAVCGPAAAIAFARKNGRNPTMQEALSLAREVGWTVEQGMAGPASQQRLLERMGVAARLQEGEPDWDRVAADVGRGNPVILSTPGHYFVAERFDPESGAFDFGESAAVLRASKGRRWFRPEELESLGMGAPRAALYMDNPASPSPSVEAGRISDMRREPLGQRPSEIEPGAAPYDPDQGPREGGSSGFPAPSDPRTEEAWNPADWQITLEDGRTTPPYRPDEGFVEMETRPLSQPVTYQDEAPDPDSFESRARQVVSDAWSGIADWWNRPSEPRSAAASRLLESTTDPEWSVGLPPGAREGMFGLTPEQVTSTTPSRRRTIEQERGELELEIDPSMSYGESLSNAVKRSQVGASVATIDAAAELARAAGQDALADSLEAEADRQQAALYDSPNLRRRATKDVFDSPYGIVEGAVESIYSIAPTVLGGLLAAGGARLRNPTLAAIGMNLSRASMGLGVAQSAGSQARELRDEVRDGTLTETQARTLAAGAGLVEYLTEKLPGIDRAFRQGLGDKVLAEFAREMKERGILGVAGRIGREMLQEGLEEAIAESYGVAIDTVFTNEKPTLMEAARRIGSAAAVGGVSGAAIAGGTTLVAGTEPGARERIGQDVRGAARGVTEAVAERAVGAAMGPRAIGDETGGTMLPGMPERRAPGAPLEREAASRELDALMNEEDDRRLVEEARALASLVNSPETEELIGDLLSATTNVEQTRARRAVLASLDRAVADLPGEDPDEPRKHEYSSTQLNLPPEVTTTVLDLGNRIATEDLAGSGRETQPHITVKYGLETNDVDDVAPLIERHGPIKATLGKTSVFPASETGSDFDVVKIDVESPELRALNADLAELPNADRHPEYKPHVTLAYVKPGTGQKYAGLTDLEGSEILLDRVMFSNREGDTNEVRLRGGPKPARATDTDIQEMLRTAASNSAESQRQGGGLTIDRWAQAMSVTPAAARRAINQLMDAGEVSVAGGSGRSTRYRYLGVPIGDTSELDAIEQRTRPTPTSVNPREPALNAPNSERPHPPAVDGKPPYSVERRNGGYSVYRTEADGTKQFITSYRRKAQGQAHLGDLRREWWEEERRRERQQARERQAPETPPAEQPAAQRIPLTAGTRAIYTTNAGKEQEVTTVKRNGNQMVVRFANGREMAVAFDRLTPIKAETAEPAERGEFPTAAEAAADRQALKDRVLAAMRADRRWVDQRQVAQGIGADYDITGRALESLARSGDLETVAGGPSTPKRYRTRNAPAEPPERKSGERVTIPLKGAKNLGAEVPSAERRAAMQQVTGAPNPAAKNPEIRQRAIESMADIHDDEQQVRTSHVIEVVQALRDAGQGDARYSYEKQGTNGPLSRIYREEAQGKDRLGPRHLMTVGEIRRRLNASDSGPSGGTLPAEETTRAAEPERRPADEQRSRAGDGGQGRAVPGGEPAEAARPAQPERRAERVQPDAGARRPVPSEDVPGTAGQAPDRGRERGVPGDRRAVEADATDQTRTVQTDRGVLIPGYDFRVFPQPHHSDDLVKTLAVSAPVREVGTRLRDLTRNLTRMAKEAGLIDADVEVTFAGLALGNDFGAFSERSADGKRLRIYANIHHTVNRQGQDARAVVSELLESIAHEIAHTRIAGHPTRLDAATGREISEVDALAEQILNAVDGARQGALERASDLFPQATLTALRQQATTLAQEDRDARQRATPGGDARGQRGAAGELRPGDQGAGRAGAGATGGVRPTVAGAPGRADAGRPGPTATGGRAPVTADTPEPVLTAQSPPPSNLSPGQDAVFDPADDALSEPSPARRFDRNLAALELLVVLEREQRPATADEQRILARYSGFGDSGFNPAFPARGEPEEGIWKQRRDRLEAAILDIYGGDQQLADRSFAAILASRVNAMYTTPEVIGAMWRGLERLGAATLSRPRVLEPSSGSGRFLGLMPARIASRAQKAAVELDDMTGRLARKLFPNSFVQITGFQNATLPEDHFDIAISNVPFATVGVVDPDWPRSKKFLESPLHNYFFAKALDKVRPGGVIAFVTSTSTMDGRTQKHQAFRQYMADRADLLTAVRLPSGAFPDTKVTVDVIFLWKRAEGEQPPNDAAKWVETEQREITNEEERTYAGKTERYPVKTPYTLNEFYRDNPQNVLGEHDAPKTGGLYGGREYTVSMTDPKWLDRFHRIMDRLPVVMSDPGEAIVDDLNLTRTAQAASKRPGSYYLDDNDQLMRSELVGRRVEPRAAGLGGHQEQRVRGMLGIRDRAQRVLDLQAKGATDAELQAAQRDLSRTYEAYVTQYGPLNADANARLMKGDPDSGLLKALENWAPEMAKTFPARPAKRDINALKAPIFTRRVSAVGQRVEKAETAADAMTVSLNERGRLSWERMSELTGRTAEDLQAELLGRGVVFENPEGGYETADQYLSGQVRKKLRKAEQAADADQRFQRNVDALKAVVPEDLVPGQITAQIGAPWVPVEYLNEFAERVLGISFSGNWKSRAPLFEYLAETGRFVRQVADKNLYLDRQAKEEWGTSYFDPMDLLDHALQGKAVVAYDSDGKGNRVRNDVQTKTAADKLQQIKQRFSEWVWEDTTRAEALAAKYNDELNGLRRREYDGSHLTFPGMDPSFHMRPHQANVVWRIVQDGTALMAHEVGFGKTAALVAAGMELRRLGLSRRNLYVVKNGTLEQFVSDFRKLYPAAKILAEDETLTKSKRNEFMARIATGDWDAVIVQQSKFTLLPVREETAIRYAERRMADLEAAMLSRIPPDGTPPRDIAQKALQKARDREAEKIARLQKQLKARQASDFYFDDLGLDSLFVDEADLYKSLPFASAKDRIKGLPTSTSQRAPDMEMKSRIVQERQGGRGVVFATGTPISNSIAEAWIMMKYLMPQQLDAMGLGHFDAWADTFGESVSDLEPNAAGVYQEVTRFSEFKNAAELSAIWQSVSDIMMAADAPDMVKRRPRLVGGENEGERIVAISPQSQGLRDLMAGFQARLDALKARKGPPQKGEDNHLTVYNEARTAAVDVRMVNPNLPEDPEGKIAKVSQNVYEVWRAERANKGTQLVFLDFGTPKARAAEQAAVVEEADAPDEAFVPESGSVEEKRQAQAAYTRIRDRLIQFGIPAREIGLASAPKNKQEFERLLAKVRSGEVRVLIGSTEKMGAGVNVQDRLAALHHVNPPWRPRDVEQREGRIVRQGNVVYGPEFDADDNVTGPGIGVKVYQYVTKGSFDEVSWGTLERKARGILQLMRRHVTERTITDAGDIVDSFAEAKAAASGRPEAMRLVRVQNELDKVGAIRQAWQEGKRTATYQEFYLPKQIEAAEEKLARIRADAATLKANTEPSLTVGKTVHDTRDPANAAVRKGMERAGEANARTAVGSYRGLQVIAERSWSYRQTGRVAVDLVGQETYATGDGQEPSDTTVDWWARLRNAAGRVEDAIPQQQAAIKSLQETLAAYQHRQEVPFQYEERYQALLRERAELERILGAAPEEESETPADAGDDTRPVLEIVQTEFAGRGRSASYEARLGDRVIAQGATPAAAQAFAIEALAKEGTDADGYRLGDLPPHTPYEGRPPVPDTFGEQAPVEDAITAEEEAPTEEAVDPVIAQPAITEPTNEPEEAAYAAPPVPTPVPSVEAAPDAVSGGPDELVPAATTAPPAGGPAVAEPAATPEGAAVQQPPDQAVEQAAEEVGEIITDTKGRRQHARTAKRAARKLEELQEQGVDVGDARDALQEYEDVTREDYEAGPDGAAEFQDAKADAYQSFVDTLEQTEAPEAAAAPPAPPVEPPTAPPTAVAPEPEEPQGNITVPEVVAPTSAPVEATSVEPEPVATPAVVAQPPVATPRPRVARQARAPQAPPTAPQAPAQAAPVAVLPPPAVSAGEQEPAVAAVPPAAPPPAAPPPAETGGGPDQPTPGPPPLRQVHTIGAGYWMTNLPESRVQDLRALLDEWAEYSRSGGVRQTEIHRLALLAGTDAEKMAELLSRSLKTDTRQAAIEGERLQIAFVRAAHDLDTAEARLADLRAARAREGDDGAKPEEIDAAVATVKAAQSTLELAGQAERRDIEAHARALAMKRFATPMGAAADLLDRIGAKVEELTDIARKVGTLKNKGTLTEEDLAALRHLMDLLGQDGVAIGGPDEQIQRVLRAIQGAIGEQQIEDKPPTAQDGKVITEKSEQLGEQIKKNAKVAGEPKGGRKRRAETPQEADERLALARELVDLDRQIRTVRQRDPGRLPVLLESRAEAARRLEDLLVEQIADEARPEGDEDVEADRDLEDEIRTRAARGMVSRILAQLRGPRPPDPNQIARSAERLRDEVIDALRTDGLMTQVPQSLQELSVELVRINRQQARLRDQNDTDGAAALEPDRQALLARMNDLLAAQVLRRLQEENPEATMLDADRELGKGPLAVIRRSIEEQMVYPQRDMERLRTKLDRELRRALSRAEISAIIDRLQDIHATGRRTFRSEDIKADLEELEAAVAALGTAGRARIATIREGLMRANLLRDRKDDKERYQQLRDAMAHIDVTRPETVGAFMQALREPGWLDYMQEYVVVNLLTSPMTWGLTGINFVSNMLNTAYRAIEVNVHGTSEARAWRAGYGTARGEAGRRAAEILDRGYLAADIERAMVTHDFAQTRPELMGQVQRLPWLAQAYRKVLYKISTRPLNSADVFQGHMLYMGEVWRGAQREANRLLRTNPKGYRVPSTASEVVYSADPDGTDRYVAQKRTTLITDPEELRTWILRNLHLPQLKHIKEQAGHIEDYTLLRAPVKRGDHKTGEGAIDNLMAQFSSLRYAQRDDSAGRKAAAIAMHTALTFFLTSYNATKVAMSFSPYGVPVNLYRAAVQLQTDDHYRAKELILKAGVGMLLMGLAAALKEKDWITGDGPTDPVEYRKWRRTHEPSSIWVPGLDGTGSWRNISGLILGLPLLATANAIEDAQEAAMKAGKRPDVTDAEQVVKFAGGLLKGSVSAVLGQSSLRGLSDIGDVFKDPAKELPRATANIGLRFIPAVSLLRWAAQMGDPLQRDPKTVGDFLAMTAPGARQSVQARLNDWGEPVANPRQGLMASLDPFRSTRSPGLDDPILLRLNEIGYSLPGPPPTINNVPLSEAEQRAFTQIAGPQLKEAVARVVSGSGFDIASPEQQRRRLDQAVQAIRKRAATEVLNAIPYDERARRRALRTQQPVSSPERRAS